VLAISFAIHFQDLPEERLAQLRRDAKSLEQLTEQLNRLVPFLLGLFIALCLRRWWTMRSQYLQTIFSSSAQLSFWLRMVLPSKTSWVRERVERDCLLGHKLVYLCTQGNQDRIILNLLRDEGLLTECEYHRLDSKSALLPLGARAPDGVYDLDLATLPFMWSAHLIYRIYTFGVRTKGAYGINIAPPVLVKMLSFCMDARTSIENIEMQLSSPLPFPYVHLVCLLVHISSVCACVKAGIMLGTDGEATVQQMVCEMVVVISVNALYGGLLCLAVVLSDPFGSDVIDFPSSMFQHRLWKAQHYASHFCPEDRDVDDELSTRFDELSAVPDDSVQRGVTKESTVSKRGRRDNEPDDVVGGDCMDDGDAGD